MTTPTHGYTGCQCELCTKFGQPVDFATTTYTSASSIQVFSWPNHLIRTIQPELFPQEIARPLTDLVEQQASERCRYLYLDDPLSEGGEAPPSDELQK